jgi:hypothetical protein
MSIQDEFIANAIQESGSLTPEQAAQLIELPQDGETGIKPETSTVPTGAAPETKTDAPNAADEATKTATDPAAAAATTDPKPNNDQLSAENAVILARDGKHTISFDKLVEARDDAKNARAVADEWKIKAESAQTELARLQEQAATRAESGATPTKVDNQVAAAQAAIDAGADPAIFGDFSEEALAKGIATLVDQRVAAQVDQRMAALEKKLAPLEARQEHDAAQAHYKAIYDAHPDADSVAESQEFAGWLKDQPSIARNAYVNALNTGSAQEIVEVFDAFKKANAGTQAASTDQTIDSKKAAQEAIAKTLATPPATLTDIPGGRVGGLTREDQMAAMRGDELVSAFENMTPAQITAFLNSQI